MKFRLSTKGVLWPFARISAKALPTLSLALALVAQAPMQMNVEQLADFIRSELALRQHSDKQIAAYLKKIQLTERLTDKTLIDLEAQGAGAKTAEALRALRDQSAGIEHTAPADVTSSPATAPDHTLSARAPSANLSVQAAPPPPPDSVHQQQIIDLMRQYALTYAQGLPNYICVRVDRRFVDPRAGDQYRSLDTVLAKVSYNEGQEQYKVYSVGGKIVDADMGGIGGGGARSSGEFAGMMRSLFESNSNAEFNWDHWAKLRGRTMAVFNYFIDSGHSSYSISYGEDRGDDQRIITAYKGLVYADANTGEIDRITFNAVDVPSSFPVRAASELIDYDLVNIGDQQSILPMRALLHMRSVHETSKNEIEFRNYRKFGADYKIQYDMGGALPESKTEEQPVTAAGSAAPAATNRAGSTNRSNSTSGDSSGAQPPAKASTNPAPGGASPWTLPTPPPPPPQ